MVAAGYIFFFRIKILDENGDWFTYAFDETGMLTIICVI
jgi:hypothetical protein